jgi:hypothetical protein
VVGVCAFSGSLYGLEWVPIKWRYLIPSTSPHQGANATGNASRWAPVDIDWQDKHSQEIEIMKSLRRLNIGLLWFFIVVLVVIISLKIGVDIDQAEHGGGGLVGVVKGFVWGLIIGPIVATLCAYFAAAVIWPAEKQEKQASETISREQPSDGNALENFITQINHLNLDKSAEQYYKTGEVLITKMEFDSAILEYIKAIRVSSPHEKWYLSAVKGLKDMGFSESDIQRI